MPVEFLGMGATHDGSETTARSGGSFDKEYTLRLARAHEENGWDRILFAYGSGAPDPHAAAANDGVLTRRRPIKNPENTGSQRLIDIASRGERYDRALWTRTAAATGGGGNSNALVGTPETVAQAILDYYDLGVRIISMRGYDLLTDAIEVGQQVIPIVRDEVAKRDKAAA
jgi:alkanesulfonate monooxygenase SsuD/methylene tetrahydromethanopterin reductase-like flavin-dependent oxidoreductase (luciferase family)